MAVEPQRAPLHRIRASSAVALVLAFGSAQAADWEIQPTLVAGGTLTDNVDLAPGGREKSEFITTFSPGITVRRNGPRLRVRGSYRLQAHVYASEGDRSSIHHQLDADARAEWIEDFFFTEAQAGISQQNVSLLRPLVSDTETRSANQAEVRRFSVSPYAVGRLGRSAIYEARYRLGVVDAERAQSDSVSHRFSLGAQSGPAWRDWQWGAQLRHDTIDRSNTPDTEIQSVNGTLGYRVNQRLRLFATAGYEDTNIPVGNSKLSGSSWSAGFRWSPIERTEVEAAVGKRFFGDTATLRVSHRTRSTVWSAGYTEDVTTAHNELLNQRGVKTADLLAPFARNVLPNGTPAQREALVREIMTRFNLPEQDTAGFFTDHTFVQKRFDAGVSVIGQRNAIVFTAFREERESLSDTSFRSQFFGSGDFSTSRRVERTGVNATYTLRMGPRTNFTTSAFVTRAEFPGSGRESEQRTLQVGLTRKLQPNATASLTFRTLQHETNAGAGDTRENRISLVVNIKI